LGTPHVASIPKHAKTYCVDAVWPFSPISYSCFGHQHCQKQSCLLSYAVACKHKRTTHEKTLRRKGWQTLKKNKVRKLMNRVTENLWT